MYDPRIEMEINLITGEFNRIMSQVMPHWFYKWGKEGQDFEVLSSRLHEPNQELIYTPKINNHAKDHY